MINPFPLLCKDCYYSVPEERSEWNLRCINPIVNANDPWALATNSKATYGSDCRSERSIKWFGKCGMHGKLWMLSHKYEIQEK